MQFGRNFLSLLFLFGFISSSSWAERPIRVLSLDGGGMRGIIETMVLAEIEKELDAPTSQIFDLVAGSSTGALVTLALSLGDQDQHPRYRAKDLLPLYLKRGKEIFHASLRHKISTGFGLWGPKYDNEGLMKNVYQVFGDTKLSEAIVPALVTGYHVTGESGVQFFSEDARAFPLDKDCFMRDVAVATTAAPLYFDLADIEFPWGTLSSIADGGLYRNNPALLAYINAKKMYPDREIEVYSLGAGKIGAEEIGRQLKGRGLLHWISPIIGHLQIADMEGDNDILHHLLNSDDQRRFFRLNIKISRKYRSMDDVSSKNFAYLIKRGNEAIKSPIFKSMIERLKQNDGD